MLIILKIYHKGSSQDKTFREKQQFLDFINQLSIDNRKQFWWVFEHDLPNLQVGKKVSYVLNNLDEILDLWKQNKIPASYEQSGFFDLNLSKFEKEDDALKFKRSFDNDPY